MEFIQDAVKQKILQPMFSYTNTFIHNHNFCYKVLILSKNETEVSEDILKIAVLTS